MSEANNDTQLINANMPDVPAQNPTEPLIDDATHFTHAEPSKYYLKDYQPPSFGVDGVELDIKLFDDYATVDSIIKMQRQAPGELILLGQDLELISLILNGEALSGNDYLLDKERLVINQAPDEVTLEIQVRIYPHTNTALEGLYIAGSGDETMFVTQCEPEGFRKITFYPDRPDVLATYTTRLEADKRFPTLLANGNLIKQGEVIDADGRATSRHYAVWEDPTNKPSYLFACVIADLDVLSDSFTTSEGREVLLELYAKSSDIDKCHLGMQALKDAMLWDEVNYGRPYDLDRYMIVAVSQFNMGAMENKGLNIFNTSCVLSSPETTTDDRSFNVKAVIAHEYFHNWTGNRITCRDWFQLCLKEGFTVFRDQSFSADQQSAAVQRIDDVSLLRAHQFSEDAGPLAHPVRPESFAEINNFYTTTVYEKGAEIVRMIANTLGPNRFRQGTDEYFRRYDGQAVTVEDFLSAMSVTDVSVERFIDWYRQPGTPTISGRHEYNANSQTLTITLSQYTRHVSGFDAPKSLPIPVSTALFHPESGDIIAERMLLLDQDEQRFTFEGIEAYSVAGEDKLPIISLLRDFSAPVQLNFDYSEDDLAFLMTHETNGFNRWQATQILVNKILLQGISADKYLRALEQTIPTLIDINQPNHDAMLAARLFDVPSQRELATALSQNYDPAIMKQKREELINQVAIYLKDKWAGWYHSLPIVDFVDTPEARGQRALRNVILDMALTAKVEGAEQWAITQYESASCMTERLGALRVMVNHRLSQAESYLADFYKRFKDEALVIDLWFSVQASSEHVTVDKAAELIDRDDFDWGTPNRVRAVVSAFAAQPNVLWTQEGLQFYTDIVAKLDKPNPVLASRLLQVLARWYTLVDDRKAIAHEQLTQLRQKVSSKHVLESIGSVLDAEK
ncbi:MAG: aminopeptidase N [Psychrobacter sp.]|nr:aminopeptidase N [Psychrobacter sp.]